MRVGVPEGLVRVDVRMHLRLPALLVLVPMVEVVPVPVGMRHPLVDVLVDVLLPGDQHRSGGHQRQRGDELPPRHHRRDQERDARADERGEAEDAGRSRRAEGAQGEDEADHAGSVADRAEKERRERDLERRDGLAEGER